MREYSEEEVQRALERIIEEGKGPNSRTSPPGSKLMIQTDAGVFECGQYFEAETVKGGKNYVIFLMCYKDFVYYAHGTRPIQKVPEADFKNKINWGDLVPIDRRKADLEKVSLSVLNLMAMANGLSFNDYLKMCFNYGDGSQA